MLKYLQMFKKTYLAKLYRHDAKFLKKFCLKPDDKIFAFFFLNEMK